MCGSVLLKTKPKLNLSLTSICNPTPEKTEILKETQKYTHLVSLFYLLHVPLSQETLKIFDPFNYSSQFKSWDSYYIRQSGCRPELLEATGRVPVYKSVHLTTIQYWEDSGTWTIYRTFSCKTLKWHFPNCCHLCLSLSGCNKYIRFRHLKSPET